jgi:Uma2 family endonuclease
MVMLANMPSRWTPADLREQPDDGRRYELIDGRLLVSPPAGEDHQQISANLLGILRASAPEGWRVLAEIGLAIGDDRVIPDLVVLPPGTPKANSDFNEIKVVRPALVIEVESPSTRTTDAGDKMVFYARAGIPLYWRVLRDGTVLVYHLTESGSYSLADKARPGDTLELIWPIPLKLDPARLITP